MLEEKLNLLNLLNLSKLYRMVTHKLLDNTEVCECGLTLLLSVMCYEIAVVGEEIGEI